MAITKFLSLKSVIIRAKYEVFLKINLTYNIKHKAQNTLRPQSAYYTRFGTMFCTIGSKPGFLGSAGRIWLTQPMICGAPKVSRQPVAVVCIWCDCDDDAWWKLLLTEKGPQPTDVEPELDSALKVSSICCVSPWNYNKVS